MKLTASVTRTSHQDRGPCYLHLHIFFLDIHSGYSNGWSTVTDCLNSVCDWQKASLNGHHDCQYLDVTTTS